MSYTIKIADINDPDIDLALRNLIRSAYNSNNLLEEKFLASNIQSNASRPSFFLVAEENNELIGCNGFIANDFLFDHINYVGYQSCWSATHPAHQSKGVFTTIINEAKKILKEQGAGFLYGIANNRSIPIFVAKLDFLETPSLVLRIPNIPFLRNSYYTNSLPGKNNECSINEEQVMKHKATQYPAAVKVIKYNDSWLWGKLIYKKKYGIKWPVFYVGGIHLATEKDVKGLISGIFRSYKVLFVQFFSCKTNRFNVLLKGWRKPTMNGFIFFNLNMPGFKHFNLMIGAIDIF